MYRLQLMIDTYADIRDYLWAEAEGGDPAALLRSAPELIRETCRAHDLRSRYVAVEADLSRDGESLAHWDAAETNLGPDYEVLDPLWDM